MLVVFNALSLKSHTALKRCPAKTTNKSDVFCFKFWMVCELLGRVLCSRKYLQVFYSIICVIAIDVVNGFM